MGFYLSDWRYSLWHGINYNRFDKGCKLAVGLAVSRKVGILVEVTGCKLSFPVMATGLGCSVITTFGVYKLKYLLLRLRYAFTEMSSQSFYDP